MLKAEGEEENHRKNGWNQEEYEQTGIDGIRCPR